MELKRFFAEPSAKHGEYITICGDEFTHMTRVLRHKVGFKIIVSLGDGYDYYCVIERLDTVALAKIYEIKVNDCQTKVKVCLFQALPKGDKIDLIMQKSVELGVAEVGVFESKFTAETKYNHERLDKIATEACKQCGRSSKMQVDELISFDEMLAKTDEYELVILPYENATEGKIGDISGLKTAKSVAIIVGSEGGFDELEVKKAVAKGIKIVSLGKRILRCETASIVTTALVMYEIGELCQ